MQQICISAAAALCLFLVSGCGGDPAARRDAHLKRGDSYQAEGKLPEAIVEYKGAVQADGQSGVARQKLGEAFVQAKDFQGAAQELIRAADLLPTDVKAQLRAGEILLAGRAFDDARGRAEKVLAIEPRNIEALILKGNALAGLKEFAGALQEIQRAIDADPTRSLTYSNLAGLQYAQGDLDQAEAAFRRAVATDPKSVMARLGLAGLYWSTNRRLEAEKEMKEAVKLDPKGVVPNRGLAMMYLGSNRAAEAEAPLKVVAENSPTLEARLMLGDYYANSGRLPEAKKVYEELAKTADGMATAKLRLASLGLLEGDRTGAYRLIDETLTRDSKHVGALVARAQLQVADGKTTEALATARSAVAADSASPLAHFVLGQILESQYQFDDAEAHFKDALQGTDGLPQANLGLARLAMRSGQFDDAARFAQAAIDRVPRFGEAYLMLARAHVANGKPASAEAPIKAMVSQFPDSPVVQAELGVLLTAKGDKAGAAAAFSRALAKDPQQIVALEGMVRQEAEQNRVPQARKRLETAVAGAPANAKLQMTAARLYMSVLADRAAAEAAVRRVLSADANNLAAYELLARIHIQANNLPGATAEFEALAQKQPKSVANHTTVGVLHHLQNNIDKAKAGYERALALNPNAPVAANNLAQLYVDRNENLEVALQLAKTAKAGMPNAHEVDDTLGWIYYKKGQAASAIAPLKSAVARDPKNPVYLYHLGAAQAALKENVDARQSLEQALKLQPSFDGADEARKILNSLK